MSSQGEIPSLAALPDAPQPVVPVAPRRGDSLLRKRLRKFRSIKRGYWSFLILLVSYLVSFLLPLLVNSTAALVEHYQKDHFEYFPVCPATAGAYT